MADFSDKWAILFTEAPKELLDRNISLIVIDMATMGIKIAWTLLMHLIG